MVWEVSGEDGLGTRTPWCLVRPCLPTTHLSSLSSTLTEPLVSSYWPLVLRDMGPSEAYIVKTSLSADENGAATV